MFRVVIAGSQGVFKFDVIARTAQVLSPAIAEYGVHPGVESRLFAQLTDPLQGQNQRLLHQVIGDHSVTAPGQRHRLEAIPVFGDPLAQRATRKHTIYDVHTPMMHHTRLFIHANSLQTRREALTALLIPERAAAGSAARVGSNSNPARSVAVRARQRIYWQNAPVPVVRRAASARRAPVLAGKTGIAYNRGGSGVSGPSQQPAEAGDDGRRVGRSGRR
ncbi:MAG: hypothetical protein JSU62_12375 [Gammaproteobacteria bacterium]|nr:MAG: hypothetical protein JSU62_12375 [Gammaproteobacteria bacterium]